MDKFVRLVAGQWFSWLTPPIKQDNHDITEILLKVTLNTISPPIFFLKNMKLENILVVVEQQFGQP